MPSSTVHAAIVLAAGRGTKFWPYNVVRQKAAFPIANVPMVRRIVEDLVDVGIQQIVVVTGYAKGSVRAALRGAPGEIRYIQQDSADGTADAILTGWSGLNGDVLVVYGDVVTSSKNLVSVLDRFNTDARPLATVLVDNLGDEDPRDWLVAGVDGDKLTGVEGHPRHGELRLAGVFALRSDAKALLRDHPGLMKQVPVGGMPPTDMELGQSLQMMVDEGHTVATVRTQDYHVDVDKPWHILEANRAAIDALSTQLEGDVIPSSAQVHDGADIEGRLVLGENAIIGQRVVASGDLWVGANASVTNGAILEGPAIIGAGTRVQNYAQIGSHSSLGPEGVYGHGAEFSGVALHRVYCFHYCEIWGVAGMAVDFGAATVCGNLRFDDGRTVWRVKGRPEVPGRGGNAAYFGDYCRTGVNAVIMPGRRIGVYSCVGPGVIAYDDVPDRQLVLVEQQLTTRSWGPERYGW